MDADLSVTATFNRWKVTITKHPKKRTESRRATFAFRSNAPGSKFKCRLDFRAEQRCKSPKTYRHLQPGRHTLTVQATGKTGRVYGPYARYSWTVLT